MQLPLVSVIMSFYNAEKYLSESIGSLLTQTYENWELLIVNDGSTDASSDVVLSFNDKRIRYFDKENGGVSSGRNLGLIQMKGDFFCFLDADDSLTANSLMSRVQVLLANLDCDYADGVVVKMDSKMERKVTEWRPDFKGNPFEDLALLSGKSFFGPSWMIRRNRDINYAFVDGLTHCEDLLFYMTLAKTGGNYIHVNETILNYRLHGNSAMSNIDGLAFGYRFVYSWLVNSDFKYLSRLFKKRANRIIFRSYLRAFRPLKALSQQIR